MQNVLKANTNINEVCITPVYPAADLELNITQEKLQSIVKARSFLLKNMEASKLQSSNPYFIENDMLMRNVRDNKQYF